MAKYFNIRCWLNCDEEELADVRKIVSDLPSHTQTGLSNEVVELYRSGWCFQDRPMNWVQHVFYGGCVQQAGIDLILDDIKFIAHRVPKIDGEMVVDSEDGDTHIKYRIRDGHLSKLQGGEHPHF